MDCVGGYNDKPKFFFDEHSGENHDNSEVDGAFGGMKVKSQKKTAKHQYNKKVNTLMKGLGDMIIACSMGKDLLQEKSKTQKLSQDIQNWQKIERNKDSSEFDQSDLEVDDIPFQDAESQLYFDVNSQPFFDAYSQNYSDAYSQPFYDANSQLCDSEDWEYSEDWEDSEDSDDESYFDCDTGFDVRAISETDPSDFDTVDGTLALGKKIRKAAKKTFKKRKKGIKYTFRKVIFGYTGNRREDLVEPLKRQVNFPVHFMKNSGLCNLILDGFPFVIEGEKYHIIEFLDKYAEKGFHFTGKNVDQSKGRVYVKVRECMEDVKLGEIIKKRVASLVMPAISEIPLDLLNNFLQLDQFKTIFCDTIKRLAIGDKPDFERLATVINNATDSMNDISIDNIVESTKNINFQEAINEAESEKPEEEAKTIGEKFVDKLKEIFEGRDVFAGLLENGFNYVNGPVDLLGQAHCWERVQVELDRLESSKSTACLQIVSSDSRVEFTDLSKTLTVLSNCF